MFLEIKRSRNQARKDTWINPYNIDINTTEKFGDSATSVNTFGLQKEE